MMIFRLFRTNAMGFSRKLLEIPAERYHELVDAEIIYRAAPSLRSDSPSWSIHVSGSGLARRLSSQDARDPAWCNDLLSLFPLLEDPLRGGGGGFVALGAVVF